MIKILRDHLWSVTYQTKKESSQNRFLWSPNSSICVYYTAHQKRQTLIVFIRKFGVLNRSSIENDWSGPTVLQLSSLSNDSICSFSNTCSDTVFLLIFKAFFMILIASSFLPCPHNHLGDSSINLLNEFEHNIYNNIYKKRKRNKSSQYNLCNILLQQRRVLVRKKFFKNFQENNLFWLLTVVYHCNIRHCK